MSSADENVLELLRSAPGPDEGSRRAIQERAANVLRPTGALARLDDVCAWLAAWQRTPRPSIERPAVIVFVADHGVTVEGVSAYPAEVTVAMLRALQEGVATAAAMARVVGADLRVVDVGVGDPTGNITREPALSNERFASCFDAGREAVAGIDCDLLIFGEMGIGNTTPAAAVAATLYGGPAEEWTGRGTGVDDETWTRKVAAVEAARARVPDDASPLEILRQVGGAELAAIAGAATEARARSIPVLLDGFVVTAAAAALEALHQGALENCLAGHRSPEPGHSLLLSKLGKEPLLDLGMRLGEASGALAAVPLVRLAASVVVDVATFEEWGLAR
jgi:nicotinate-nucleotide--dimethylbenzimidazole phosphoribosyltransferase